MRRGALVVVTGRGHVVVVVAERVAIVVAEVVEILMAVVSASAVVGVGGLSVVSRRGGPGAVTQPSLQTPYHHRHTSHRSLIIAIIIVI